ncbi:MAG: hypothetical protein WC150_04730 [Bacteroidia bacterium]
MNSKAYLLDKLGEIRIEFPEFSPYFEYDHESTTYFVHVIPEKIDKETRFNELCGMLIVDMMNKYPNEYLCFITSNSLTKLKRPELVFREQISFYPIKEGQRTSITTQNDLTPEFSGFSFY